LAAFCASALRCATCFFTSLNEASAVERPGPGSARWSLIACPPQSLQQWSATGECESTALSGGPAPTHSSQVELDPSELDSAGPGVMSYRPPRRSRV